MISFVLFEMVTNQTRLGQPWLICKTHNSGNWTLITLWKVNKINYKAQFLNYQILKNEIEIKIKIKKWLKSTMTNLLNPWHKTSKQDTPPKVYWNKL